MVGHQPFSDQIALLTDRCSHWSAICADQFICNCNSLLLAYCYLSLSMLFNWYWGLHSIEASTRCTCVSQSIAPHVYSDYRLWVTGNVAKKWSLQWLHEQCFQGEEKKVMYTIFTEWRCGITALSCLECVVCWLEAWEWNESQWSACRVSFNLVHFTGEILSWVVITVAVWRQSNLCYSV